MIQNYTKLSSAPTSDLSQESLMAMFRAFDKDASGFIDEKEIKATMLELGIPVEEEDVDSMLEEIGALHGRIYFEGKMSPPTRIQTRHVYTKRACVVATFKFLIMPPCCTEIVAMFERWPLFRGRTT